MSDREMTNGRTASGDEPSPPEEPFAYLSNNPGYALRSPTGTIIVYAVFASFGAWLTCSSLLEYPRARDGWLLALAVVGIFSVAVGLYVMYMGVRRWQWKREYERVMGRSPW